MERREFMKLCSLAGLGLVGTGLSGTGDAEAATEMAPQLFIEVSANGGWDVIAGLDPKGGLNALYEEGDIPTYGSLRVAPDMEVINGQATGVILAPGAGPMGAFFTKWHQYWTIMRGVDCETNGHDTGQMNTFSGRLTNGSPAFAALLAAATGRERPLSFITNGGYSFTAGTIAPTRLGDVGTLQRLIYPNRIDPTSVDNLSTFHTDETFKRIMATRQERLNKYQQLQNLPKMKNAMSLLYTSRLGMEDLKLINQYLPTTGDPSQADLILAAYMAGLTCSATMDRGGFDSHGQNDDAQFSNQGALFADIDQLLTAAQNLGVLDRLVVFVGSDFGRTPDYNGAQGRDHYNVGACMIMGQGIAGDRMIGETDDGLLNKKMDLASLSVNDGGVSLTNGHIHKWLRKYFKIETHEVVKLYPIPKEGDINLGGV